MMSPETKYEAKDILQMGKSELFKTYAQSQSGWLCQAVGLLRAAYRLWDEHQCRFEKGYAYATENRSLTRADDLDMQTNSFSRAYLLLTGLAFENLIKGLVFIRQNLNCINGELPQSLRGHKLTQLATKDARLALSKDEKLTLDRLSKAVVWQGRYQTPLKESHLPDKHPAMTYALVVCHPRTTTELFISIMSNYSDGSFINMTPDEQRHFLDDLAALLKAECPEICRVTNHT